MAHKYHTPVGDCTVDIAADGKITLKFDSSNPRFTGTECDRAKAICDIVWDDLQKNAGAPYQFIDPDEWNEKYYSFEFTPAPQPKGHSYENDIARDRRLIKHTLETMTNADIDAQMRGENRPSKIFQGMCLDGYEQGNSDFALADGKNLSVSRAYSTILVNGEYAPNFKDEYLLILQDPKEREAELAAIDAMDISTKSGRDAAEKALDKKRRLETDVMMVEKDAHGDEVATRHWRTSDGQGHSTPVSFTGVSDKASHDIGDKMHQIIAGAYARGVWYPDDVAAVKQGMQEWRAAREAYNNLPKDVKIEGDHVMIQTSKGALRLTKRDNQWVQVEIDKDKDGYFQDEGHWAFPTSYSPTVAAKYRSGPSETMNVNSAGGVHLDGVDKADPAYAKSLELATTMGSLVDNAFKTGMLSGEVAEKIAAAADEGCSILNHTYVKPKAVVPGK